MLEAQELRDSKALELGNVCLSASRVSSLGPTQHDKTVPTQRLGFRAAG